MLMVLALIDLVMIANLLIMGGYETFVSRLNFEGHPDQPEWLSHVNAGLLKVKFVTALIGTSIHLLQTFIEADRLTDRRMMWQVIIHLTFVISAFMLAWTPTASPAPPLRSCERRKRKRTKAETRTRPELGALRSTANRICAGVGWSS